MFLVLGPVLGLVPVLVLVLVPRLYLGVPSRATAGFLPLPGERSGRPKDISGIWGLNQTERQRKLKVNTITQARGVSRGPLTNTVSL